LYDLLTCQFIHQLSDIDLVCCQEAEPAGGGVRIRQSQQEAEPAGGGASRRRSQQEAEPAGLSQLL